MRNGFGLIAVFLILIGAVFLAFVSWGGFMSYGMMSGTMPSSMQSMMGGGSFGYGWFLPLGVVLLILLMLFLIMLAYFLGRGGNRHQHTCPNCGRNIEPDWRICPYCGHPQG